MGEGDREAVEGESYEHDPSTRDRFAG